VIVLKSRAADPAPDPVVFNQGGPEVERLIIFPILAEKPWTPAGYGAF